MVLTKIFNSKVVNSTFFTMTLLLTSAVFASSPNRLGGWGVGAETGGESSVSLQLAYDSDGAFTFGAGTYYEDTNLYIDHIWFLTNDTVVHPYVGMGLGAAFDDSNDPTRDDVSGQIRLPIGLSYYAVKSSLSLYGQIIPSFDTEKDSEMFAQIGLKYFFSR